MQTHQSHKSRYILDGNIPIHILINPTKMYFYDSTYYYMYFLNVLLWFYYRLEPHTIDYIIQIIYIFFLNLKSFKSLHNFIMTWKSWKGNAQGFVGNIRKHVDVWKSTGNIWAYYLCTVSSLETLVLILHINIIFNININININASILVFNAGL